MDIFISWSGERSRQMANALKLWLPRVIQSVRPWVSTQNIAKGSRWSSVLSKELGEHVYGLLCVTPENRSSTWLLFEAGALSKTDASRTYTLLLGLKYSDVEQPLAQFNHTLAEKEDMKLLLRSINESTAAPLSDELLTHSFETNWQFLDDTFKALLDQGPQEAVATPASAGGERAERSMIEEMLGILRAQTQRGERTKPKKPRQDSTEIEDLIATDVAEILLEHGLLGRANVAESDKGYLVRILWSTGGSTNFHMDRNFSYSDLRDRLLGVVAMHRKSREGPPTDTLIGS